MGSRSVVLRSSFILQHRKKEAPGVFSRTLGPQFSSLQGVRLRLVQEMWSDGGNTSGVQYDVERIRNVTIDSIDPDSERVVLAKTLLIAMGPLSRRIVTPRR